MLVWPRLHEANRPCSTQPAPSPLRVPTLASLPTPTAYYGQDREAIEVMLRDMTGMSERFMEVLLDEYCPEGGFEIDIGGTSAAFLEVMMRRVPTIRQGVNFDLPEVFAAVPPIAGEVKGCIHRKLQVPRFPLCVLFKVVLE